jgi:hypothetical protein
MADMVGAVTQARYQALVTEGRELVALASRCQFRLGDAAIEVEPIRGRGGAPAAEGATVEASLQAFADDLMVSASTLKSYRWVASRWPAARRAASVSHTVHAILASIEDEQERWVAINDPPLDERTGRRRWTVALAQRRVGHSTGRPESVAEKVNAIHDLARDEQVAVAAATDLLRRPEVTSRVAAESKVDVIAHLTRDDQVAAEVATDLLRRPRVAAQVVEDDTARHLVNRAQVDRVERAVAPVRARSPLAPAAAQVAHSLGYVELVGACHAFVSAAGRVVPTLRGRAFSTAERAVLDTNIAKVRGAADWIEGAVQSGNVSLDEGLAALLRGGE